MTHADRTRVRQRLEKFAGAADQPKKACALENYTDLERAGLVQTFEFTFDMAWKALRVLLEREGFDAKTPREIIRRSFESGFLDEDGTETKLAALMKRNTLSHTYEEETAREAEALIKERYAPALVRLCERLEGEAAP